MARDLETGKEERSGRQRLYLAALRGDWDDMKLFFDKYPELLLTPLTIHEDTAFHIAAYNEEKELLEHFVELLPRSSLLEALNKKNKHGNNTFHEVAMTERVDTAEFLVNKLQPADGSRLKEMLEDRNKLGETPIYRAVAHGQTKMAQYFATEVGDLSYHFRRKDEMSILHIAVIGQHFDTAIWLLEEDQELAKLKVNELTCLHLLARMPSAFRSTSHMTRLEKMLYYWIPFPEDIYRNRQPQ